MGKILKALEGLIATIVASVVLILLAIVYFTLNMLVIKTGASWAGFKAIEGGTIVLTAGIIAASAIIGSALKK